MLIARRRLLATSAMVATLEGDEPFLADAYGDPAAGHQVQFAVSTSGPLDLVVLGEQGLGAQATAIRFTRALARGLARNLTQC